MRPLKSTGGKIVKALAFILFFTTIAETLGNPENYLIEFFGLIISAIADGLSAFLCWICEKGIKLLAKTIPAFGGLLGAILGVAISRLLGIYFDKKIDRITAKFKTKVNTRKFKIHDYLVTYITCIV